MKHEVFVNFDDMVKKIKIYFLIPSLIFIASFFAFVFFRNTFLLVILPLCLVAIFLLRFYYQKIFKFYKTKPYLMLDEEKLVIHNLTDTFHIEWSKIQTIDMNDIDYVIQADRDYQLSKNLLGNDTTQTIEMLKRYTEKYGNVRFIY